MMSPLATPVVAGRARFGSICQQRNLPTFITLPVYSNCPIRENKKYDTDPSDWGDYSRNVAEAKQIAAAVSGIFFFWADQENKYFLYLKPELANRVSAKTISPRK